MNSLFKELSWLPGAPSDQKTRHACLSPLISFKLAVLSNSAIDLIAPALVGGRRERRRRGGGNQAGAGGMPQGEAHLEVQRFAPDLRKRGVLLAVSSAETAPMKVVSLAAEAGKTQIA
jgi:hypothetical protein